MTSVTVVIPAYNEGMAFGCSLARIADYFAMHASQYRFEYVIVDDGSSDQTTEIAQCFAQWHRNVSVIRHDCNLGLGAALRSAFRTLRTEYAIVLDADLSYTPTTGMELLEALERENADIALASPYMRGGSIVNVPPVRRILSREANRLLSMAAGHFSTFTCMVRAYRVSALKKLTFRSDRMAAIPELLLGAMKRHVRIVEVPAALTWSDERRSAGGRLNVTRALAQTVQITGLSFRHRPSLWLAVPGLVPGLLPLVVAVLLFLHVNATTLAAATVATVAVQYASLALFAGYVGAFVAGTHMRRHHQFIQKRIHTNDYHASEYYGAPPAPIRSGCVGAQSRR